MIKGQVQLSILLSKALHTPAVIVHRAVKVPFMRLSFEKSAHHIDWTDCVPQSVQIYGTRNTSPLTEQVLLRPK
jgi:hypothetical protein